MSDQTGEVSKDTIRKDDLIDVVDKVQRFADENGGTVPTNVTSLHDTATELSALAGRNGEIPETQQPKPTDREIANWQWAWPF